MDTPNPPSDPELLNIIDKLAEFVARNGQEFEAYTKEKQRDNPKFSFLHGGEFHDYYRHKVEELRQSWTTQHPPTDYQQQLDYNYQWGDNSRAPGGDYSWDQYSGGDYAQRYVPPGGCGWSGSEQGRQWYPPPWPGAPPNYPTMPYGQPYPDMNAPDGYRGGRGYGMPYGYSGPPNQGPHYQGSADYGYPEENYGYSSTTESVPEFNESDVIESEKNLAAQREALMARQSGEIDELLERSLFSSVQEKATQMNISVEQMNEVIQPIIESCTKDNISKGKTWVIDRGSESDGLADLIADYMLCRAASREASFDLRLHLVYLVNDLLHHFKRRGAPNHLQTALQRTVPIMFCLASELADEEKKTKLNRVLDLWDTNAYLPPSVLEQMRPEHMESFMENWRQERKKANESAIDKIKATIDAEYRSLEQQHNEFAHHVRQQLARSQQDSEQPNYDAPPRPMDGAGFDTWGPMSGYNGAECPREPYMPPHMPPGGYPPHGWSGRHRGPPPPNWGLPPYPMGRPPYPPRDYGRGRADSNVYIEGEDDEPEYDRYYDQGQSDYYRSDDRSRGDSRFDRSSHRRPSRFSSATSRSERSDSEGPRGTRSRGFHGRGDERDEHGAFGPQGEFPKEPIDLEPKCPPWELPAGLMHSLIRLCDFEHKPLDESKLRLLPPKPPTERLMTAVDNFYLPPSHDRTRDGEGWERLGLYEFYMKKEKARAFLDNLKRSAEHSSSGQRHRSRKHSGSSGVGSPSGDESQSDPTLGIDSEHTKPFVRDAGGSRPTAFHLSHITAYPTIAVGQGIRTGVDALTSAPPPMSCMPGAYPGLKPVGPVVGPGGMSVPPPMLPGAPPGFPGPNFFQFPPPSLSQPPPANMPSGLIQRSVSTPGYSANRSRYGSDRSRSASKSRSNSRSGSDRSSRSRSRSRSGSQSSPENNGSTDGKSQSARSRQRRSSRSGSRSASPPARFTSAPGPGGIDLGSNSLSAARAAAMAVAASITKAIKAKGDTGSGSGPDQDGSGRRSSRFSGQPNSGSYGATPPQNPPGRSRSRFSSAVPNPNRVAEMHLLGEAPTDR